MSAEATFTYEQVSLAVREAANTAYEMGKMETVVKVADFIESLALHPTRSPSLETVAQKVRDFDA
jgi:hypothetical protein